MLIDTLDWYPWSILDRHSIDTLVDTPLTTRLTLDRGATNFWSIQMSLLTLGRLLTDCWSSVDRVSTKYWSGCRSSIDRDVDRGYWSRASIHTQPRMPLAHMIWNIPAIKHYIIIQVILAFWLVLAYDLLEDRHTIDVIISKFFPLCFEMAESFENLDNVLHDWAKDKVQKKSCRGIEQEREA